MACVGAQAAHCAAFACRAQRSAAHHAPRLPPPPPRGCEAAHRRARRSAVVCCAAGDSASDGVKQASASQLQALEAALAAAIAREDYAEAARVRDKLRFARADAVQGVEAASAAFYSAFERMNSRDMARAWGFGDHVSCTHPGAATIVGRDEVLESWDAVFAAGGKLKIRLQDVVVHAAESLGYITCVEVVDSGSQTGRLTCTNIFELQPDGSWRIVHHTAAPAPRL